MYVDKETRKSKRNVRKWQNIESKLIRNCGTSYNSIKKIKKDNEKIIEITLVMRKARKLLRPWRKNVDLDIQ